MLLRLLNSLLKMILTASHEIFNCSEDAGFCWNKKSSYGNISNEKLKKLDLFLIDITRT